MDKEILFFCVKIFFIFGAPRYLYLFQVNFPFQFKFLQYKKIKKLLKKIEKTLKKKTNTKKLKNSKKNML